MSHLRYCGKPNNQHTTLGMVNTTHLYYPSILPIYGDIEAIVGEGLLLGLPHCPMFVWLGNQCIPSPFMAEKASLANIFPKFSPLSDGENPFVLICVDGTLNPCKRGVRCILFPN